jgi:IS1 family transposase
MNRLDTETRARVIACLVEGCSLRSTCRLTGVAMNTVLKLLAELGAACDAYQDRVLRGLSIKRVQCDEIWSFCYAKEKNVPERLKGEPGVGSVWTWTAIDSDTKLMLTWYIGKRDAYCANRFMLDVASRVTGRIQLTTDGYHPYRYATAMAFADGMVDYAQLVKVYAGGTDGNPESKYSQPECCGARREARLGEPDFDHISTSHVERANLTIRMSSRRFTRLTNAHSKKVENHEASTAILFMFYNFCRKHLSLKGRTPAMAAGVADHVWGLDEVIALLPEQPKGRVRKIGAPPDSGVRAAI